MPTCLRFLTQYYLPGSLSTSAGPVNRSFSAVPRVDSVRAVSTRSSVPSGLASLLPEADHQELLTGDPTLGGEQATVLILEILNDPRWGRYKAYPTWDRTGILPGTVQE